MTTCRHRVKAPLVFPRALNCDIVSQWVAEWPVPQVRPGQLVVQDNRSVHQDGRARAAIEAAGCRLEFLPVSSPDDNPIELVFALVFAALKGHLRATKARTADALIDAMGAGRDQVTPQMLRGYNQHGGYPTDLPGQHL